MPNIKLESDGFLIEDKVLFGASTPHANYVNLAFEAGEDIITERLPHAIIEYPGEYDISGVGARVFLGKDNKLNYLLNIDGKKIGIIQTPKILEEDEVTGMDFRYYLEDCVERKLDQLEMSGKRYKLSIQGGDLEIQEKGDVEESSSKTTTSENDEYDE